MGSGASLGARWRGPPARSRRCGFNPGSGDPATCRRAAKPARTMEPYAGCLHHSQRAGPAHPKRGPAQLKIGETPGTDWPGEPGRRRLDWPLWARLLCTRACSCEGHPGLASGTEASLGTGACPLTREGPRPHLSLKGLSLRLSSSVSKELGVLHPRVPWNNSLSAPPLPS